MIGVKCLNRRTVIARVITTVNETFLMVFFAILKYQINKKFVLCVIMHALKITLIERAGGQKSL